jgi:hypothetical protein
VKEDGERIDRDPGFGLFGFSYIRMIFPLLSSALGRRFW